MKTYKWKKEWKGEFRCTKEDVWSALVMIERPLCDDDTKDERMWKQGWNEALKAAREKLDVNPF